MDFLNKIKRHLKGNDDNEFRKQVLHEKKQKYLFSDDIKDKYRSSRAGLFMRKRKISPFSTTSGYNLSQTKKKILESHAVGYIGLFLLFLSGYIIFFSPYFQVSPSHVILEARNEGIDIGVAYRSIEEVYGKSLFFLDEEEIAFTLKKSLKNLSHISIDKLYPNGIKVLMSSTPITYQARIFGFEREWKMSDNGVLIPKSTNNGSGATVLKKIEVISEALKGEVFFDYKQIISDEKMLIINKIIELFESEWSDLTIQKIRYFVRENEIHITLNSNTVIIFTLESDSSISDYSSRVNRIKNQLLGLKTYIDTYRSSLSDGSISYIDTRIVKKIFICKEQATCKNNLIKIYGETYK